jgi:hypothetical protein
MEEQKTIMSQVLKKAIMPFLLLANIGMLVFYSLVTFKLQFTTDSATKSLLANEVLNLGELLPAGWFYVNNDIWVVLNHLFLVPLIQIFGLNYLSYAVNNLLFYCFYGVAIYFFVSRLTISSKSKYFIAILAISSLSYYYAMYLFGEIAYLPIYAFIFLLLGIVNRVTDADESSLNKYYLGLFLLVAFFTIHNPQRVLIFNLMPILLASASLYFIDSTQKVRYLRLSLVGLASFIVSAIFHYIVIQRNVTITSGANTLLFADYEQVLSHVSIFFAGLLDVFNLVDGEQHSPFSFPGLVRLGSFCFFALTVLSLVKVRKKFDRENVVVLIPCLLITYYLFVDMFLYIFTVPLAQNVATFRYFYPVVLLSFIVMAFFLEQLRWARHLKLIALVVVVLFLSMSNYSRYVSPGLSDEFNPHEPLAEYLTEHGLTYGFASFWHSYVTTVFAENKALIAPVHLSNFVPHNWLSSKDWYTQYGADETFIVLDNDEYQKNYNAIITKIGTEPVRVDRVNGFWVAVFDRNVAYELDPREYFLELEHSIDFSIKGYPKFIREWDGFSHYEPSFRWSEGKKSSLAFSEKLPGSFNLVFSGFPFDVSKSSTLEVVVGTDVKTVILKSGVQSYQVNFRGVDADEINFIYKRPFSPIDMGMGTDKRKLSFAFSSVEIWRASLF